MPAVWHRLRGRNNHGQLEQPGHYGDYPVCTTAKNQDRCCYSCDKCHPTLHCTERLGLRALVLGLTAREHPAGKLGVVVQLTQGEECQWLNHKCHFLWHFVFLSRIPLTAWYQSDYKIFGKLNISKVLDQFRAWCNAVSQHCWLCLWVEAEPLTSSSPYKSRNGRSKFKISPCVS